MTSLKTSIKTITYLSDIGCLEIQGASLPSIKRSAAIIKDAYIAITPDTSILHMASAYNTPVVAIYADYKTRWPAMADVSESVVVGQKIDNISLDEFAKALKSVLARI